MSLVQARGGSPCWSARDTTNLSRSSNVAAVEVKCLVAFKEEGSTDYRLLSQSPTASSARRVYQTSRQLGGCLYLAHQV